MPIEIKAPMPGLVLDILVNEGDEVVADQPLMILEAMKMQHEILAGIDGIVSSVHVAAGTQIAADTRMIELDGGDA